jgi:hypothetical protein
VVGQRYCEGTHQHDERALGRIVGRGIRLGLEPIGGSGDDDTTAALFRHETTGKGLRDKIGRGDIEPDRLVPELPCHVEERHVEKAAGITDERVELGLGLEGAGDELGGGVRL